MTSKVWAILPSVLEDIDTEKKAVLQNAAFLNALLPQVRHTETTVRNGVAVISIEGAVYRKKSWFMPGMTHKQIKNEIEKALQHDEVKAIFYNIYSPGGTVAGTQELASFIKEAAAIKPSCAFVDGMFRGVLACVRNRQNFRHTKRGTRLNRRGAETCGRQQVS